MKSLQKDWPLLARRLRRAGRVLVLLDFDGTLCPIVSDPGRARMDARLRKILSRLGGRPGVHVGVISGRRLADVEKRVGLKGFYYGGNHGLDIRGPGLRFRHPGALSMRPVLKRLAAACRRALAGLPGARVEDKGFSVSVHDRGVSRGDMPSFLGRLRAVKRAAAGDPLWWRRGLKVWEALPLVGWHKGRAARHLIRRLGYPFVVAAGDDRTDEDLFRAVNGLSLRVAPRGPTRARYVLAAQKDVPLFLKRLEEALHENGR